MAKSGNVILRLLNIIGKLADDRTIYTNIKNDPDLRPYSKHFGWSAIWHSLLFAVFTGGGGVLTYAAFTKNWGVFLNIIAIIFGIGLVLVGLEMLLFAFSHTIKQIKINRRAISWIALVVFVLSLGAVVGLLAIVFGNIS